ncbi:MAG TPA: S-methyl-5'-thioadenosine phosphorylase [Thermoanaerobaculia bacterium]|nr:S-methyl-5'-thioadenosine phosphorylase [Thermoanaerobaculia bacterium]
MSGEATVGVIGGSGLYEMADLTVLHEKSVETPFGDPSDAFVIGELEGVRVAFLARHGRGHRLLPSELNFRANVWAFKALGVETLLSASAVGSMREQYAPMDIVFPHQFIDRTRHRRDTFFGDGIVAHVSFANPICLATSAILAGSSRATGSTTHEGGVYLCIEGPQFSTRAESLLYRSWGVDLIGMTNLQEAKLAREAEICYTTIALVTDYDCWHPAHGHVTVEMIVGNLTENAKTAQQVIAGAVETLPFERTCECATALKYAIITRPDAIPAAVRDELAPIVGKYV